MGLIKTALLAGSGLYAVKHLTKTDLMNRQPRNNSDNNQYFNPSGPTNQQHPQRQWYPSSQPPYDERYYGNPQMQQDGQWQPRDDRYPHGYSGGPPGNSGVPPGHYMRGAPPAYVQEQGPQGHGRQGDGKQGNN